MPGINPHFLSHKLAVCPLAKPVAQRRRKMGAKRSKVVKEEVNKLRAAEFIREVMYTTRLANVIMMKKYNGKWRMCIDYTDLNKACAKDAYPLPNINELVDRASGHAALSFLDAFSGYNQIRIHLIDEEKTAFITEEATYCYRVMLFGLKNARATYQRLMDKKAQPFEWTEECEEAFSTLNPKPWLPPSIGQANFGNIDSAVEKTALALLSTARRLRPCFQRHQIVVQTDCPIAKVLRKPELARRMTIRVDGSTGSSGSGAGVIVEGPNELIVEQSLRFGFKTSKYQAEYEALLVGLKLAEKLGVKTVRCLIDSKIVAEQVNYAFQQELTSPSIGVHIVLVANDWKQEITSYITQGKIPTDPAEARAIRMTAARFTMIGDDLYKRGFSTPLLKCIATDEVDYVLREVHLDICVSEACNLIHQPADDFIPITAPWPFCMWGMNILGPFPMAKGQVKFLLVVIDYFTKWIEAEPLATISAQNVQKFLWKNIITRFGIPQVIVSDNGLQFTDKKLNSFLEGLHIKHRVTSVEHPQSNGQAEAANKVILGELKKMMMGAKGEWAEMIPKILWAYRCTPQSSIKETPFRMVYGTNAMIPVEDDPKVQQQGKGTRVRVRRLSVEGNGGCPERPKRRKTHSQLGRTMSDPPKPRQWRLQARRVIWEAHFEDLELHSLEELLQLA
ncbi:hypothetical protein VNO78_34793 [Psophocarpus tetragonolobus]|uniref:Integrase catalytic domain-containing protein n=1 Tax=Psophocarpus tetragonolobus TaxID=3891 RepID=A0AAN9NSR4_PSOTE